MVPHCMRNSPAMIWKRLSVTSKLFVVMALTAVIVIGFMAVMIAVSMRSGFSQYLLEAELDRFDSLDTALSESYDPAKPGWPELSATARAWSDFVRQHFRPPNRPPHPPLLHGGAQAGAPSGGALRQPPRDRPRPPPDPLQLGTRLSLLDANGNRIAGAPLSGGLVAKRLIVKTASDGISQTIGWIALAAPRGGAMSADDLFLSGQFRTLILTSLFAIALSAMAAFLLARQFLAPVRGLVGGAKLLAASDYSARLENHREDEFGALIDQFNALAEGLETARKAERQWLTDASHELQTPLAILRAEIEALQDGLRQPDEKTLSGLHKSVLRLSRLVADLNSLSQAREGGLITTMADEDFGSIVDEAVEAARAHIEASNLRLQATIDHALILPCDRMRIRQLLDNLIENARRYTSAPGTILISTHREESGVRLLVDDTAPAPPDEALDNLFERFYRAEPSRARTHGGSGLGLTICRAIVLAHVGSIKAERSDLGGLRVNIFLPFGVAWHA